MKNIESINYSKNMMESLIEKSQKSVSFRRKFIENPVEVFEEYTGKPFKSFNMNVIVEDQTDSDIIYLNIPRNVSDSELTCVEMDNISAGYSIIRGIGRAYGHYVQDLYAHIARFV